MAYVLGIDSGTTVVKSVVFDLAGREVAVARRETPVESRVRDGSEVDMNRTWALTAETIREVIGRVGADAIDAVGISGTACGVWPVDDEGRPVRHAIMWNDGRAAPILAEWQRSDFYDETFAISGNAPFPGYPLVALRWLLEHEPHVAEQARWFLFHKDWLRYNLTGEISTDESDASYFPWDLRQRQHSDTLLEGAGLGPIRHKLPPVRASADVVGEVTISAAAVTGLNPGTPVVSGAVDVVASLIGGGAFRSGQACGVLGTSFLNTIVSAEPSFEPPNTGVQACMPDGLWGRSLVNTSGTICIDWMIDTLAQPEKQTAAASGESIYPLIEKMVENIPVGAGGLIFLPYLNTAGIISPFADANARGQFFGLSMSHTRAHMMRAVYEGTALAMRDCLAVIEAPVEEVLLVGGGARSDFWAQMFADATGRRIVIPEGTEFGARGAAILGAVGAGLFPSLSDAISATVRAARAYEPDLSRTREYDALYALYRHLYLNARPGWQLRREVLDTLSSD